MLPGNHDPLDAASIFRSRTFGEQAREHIIVLTDSAPIPVPGLANVEVVQYVALGDRHSLTDVGTSGGLCYSGTLLVDLSVGAKEQPGVLTRLPGCAGGGADVYTGAVGVRRL